MNEFIRFEIITRDRLGITVEILEKIYDRKINLISMEVFFEKVCVKIEEIDNEEKELLKSELYQIKDVLSISEIELLYHERDEKRLLEVIDSLVSNNEEEAFKDIIGSSIQIENVKKMTTIVAKNNSTVLLRGDSGTGKELFARAIHNLSERKNKRFVTINCAAIPENLLESELFGYEKGSFTGAMQSGREGLFKEADAGTLFLDEIGELPMYLQAKLLRVIQEGSIRKIGSNKEEYIDVRIISATNKKLEEMIENKAFREDLYYRLNVIPMYIPKLSERLEDIPSLVQFFIAKFNKKLKKNVKGVELEFINALMQYYWPGNVRELQNVIERAMNLCEGDILTKRELIIEFGNKNNVNIDVPISNKVNEQLPLKELMEQCEKEIIRRTLSSNKSCRKTAKLLGVSHTTIINKVKKYDIKL
ncbi:sigma 54-interacting transcriptional regulator [Clostridium omnivorum]|uniref:HTH-type transcriptional regulatory protein TyrR n=1 Tax=Clostridium omnivorum TaxID=1604902 RepID=A0ABQ5N7Z9_9CLOT|nr:sigma 54-interacting transcriptional regulator [Clostridium sp. E14]GLC31324.1 hypothetical protein bsdE14_27340 [Clostridium sp. E14]